MNVPLRIAWRYLFAKKSHNVINVMSFVSAFGMAVGTAALILILSVYNGFNRIIDTSLGDFDPDVAICREDGDFFSEEDLHPVFADSTAVAAIGHRLQFDGFLTYGEAQSAAHVCGTDSDFSLVNGDIRFAAIGATLAEKMKISPRFLSPITVYCPDRTAKFSVVNPEASIRRADVYPGRLFSVNADIDAGTIVIPLETARELFGIEGICSSLDIRLNDGSAGSVKRFISSVSIPEGFVALDRKGQHKELYRMMELEKAAVFAILLLVVLIVALNIFSSLSMLRIEKEYDMGTLRAMGAQESDIRKVFVYEGWLISLAGMLTGLVIGIALVLLQQHFGFVKLPGNLLVDAYPVCLSAWDVILSSAGVALIGLLISLLASARRS